jgi:alpha-tubulin suppressor-like RCC1 family protein
MNRFANVVRHLSAFLIFGLLLSTFSTFSQTGREVLKKSNNTGLSGKGLLVSESFDDVTFPPSGWQNIQLTGTGLWARTTAGTYPSCSPHSGEGMAFYDNYNFGSNVSAMLVTPELMMTGGLPKNVNFWMYRDDGWPTYPDSLAVYYNSTPDLNGAIFLGMVERYYWMSDWYEFNFPIPASVSGSYYVIFKANSNWGNDIFLDDIEIRTLNANDAGVVSIVSPPAMVIAGVVTPEVIIRNFGTQAQTNIPVKYRNGQTGQVFTEIVPFLDADTSVNVVFPAWTATPGGPYEFLFYTDLPGDEDTSNDTIAKQIVCTSSNQSYTHSFSGGLYHSLSVCDDKTVMAWGSNANGQLGNGTNTDSNIPVQVANLTDFTRVSAGKYHSVALKEDGTAWCFGKNESGQLGNGGTASSNVPVQVSGLTGITGIAGGDEHTLALKDDGTVWAWGNNYWGQLGDGTYNNSTTPVQVTGISGAIAVAAGEQFSLVLLDNGTIYGWGGNQFGQLGNGTLIYSNIPVLVPGFFDVIDIAVGTTHSVALKNDGTVWAWGYNYLGQLGNGNNTDSKIPVQTIGLSGITSISAGNASTYAVRYDGTAWAWGWNSNGQLGNGTTTDSNLPVQVTGPSDMMATAGGAFHGLALDQAGSLFAWGSNDYGQLGDGTNTESHVPVSISLLCPVYATIGETGRNPEEQVRLYPNPTDGHFVLQIEPEKRSVNEGIVEIFNIYGGKIMTSRIGSENLIPLDLTGKGKGLFIVRVTQGSAIRYGKIIVN